MVYPGRQAGRGGGVSQSVTCRDPGGIFVQTIHKVIKETVLVLLALVHALGGHLVG